jgi:4-carboxymuconolactone decarboxylase
MKNISLMILILTFSVADVDKLYAQTKGTNTNTLSKRQSGIVGVSALAAVGDQPGLAKQFNNGLDAGLSLNELKEVVLQLSAYCGFPRSLNAINTLQAVTEERKKKGITDQEGTAPLAIDKTANRYELGKANLEKLTGQPETGPKTGYAAFVPTVEVFLKEHLFADIFSRGVLSFQDRELVTVSALTSIGGVEGQLKSHLGISVKQGLTKLQLTEMIEIISQLVGREEADAGQAVLKQL